MDVTRDGQPELFVGTKFEENVGWNVKETAETCGIYTWSNNRVIFLDGIILDPMNPWFLYTAQKEIVSLGHGTSGYQNWTYRNYTKNPPQITEYKRIEKENSVGGEDYDYFYEGTSISQAEFEKHTSQSLVQDDMEDFANQSLFQRIHFIENTAANRQKYLSY